VGTWRQSSTASNFTPKVILIKYNIRRVCFAQMIRFYTVFYFSDNKMSHLAPEEKQYYGTPANAAVCWSVNNAGTDFNSFLTDVSKMNPAGSDTGLKNACFGDPINETDCLNFISTNYGKYGGLLGPVPTGETPPYLKNNSGTYAYPGDPGNTTELLTSFGLPNRGASSDVKDGKWVITGPASNTASLTLGDAGRNPFYCSGKGVCGADFESCTCDDGYEPVDGTCKPIPNCSDCAKSITVTDFSTKKMGYWPLSDCTAAGCQCLGPDGNPRQPGEGEKTSWPKSGVRFGDEAAIGPMQQFGVDIDVPVVSGANTMDKCGLCSPDDSTVSFDTSSWYHLKGPPTCTNGTNWGCCSGNCYLEGENLYCGCLCDKHCPDGYICEDGGGSCVKKTNSDCWAAGKVYVPGWGGNCCHPGGFAACPDATDNCN
jgi:hypothetical protein